MSRRLLGAAALVVALAAPASAADGVNAVGTVGADQVAGWCTFYGTVSPDGGAQFAYGGRAVATSTSGSAPEETVVTCTMTSPAQGLPGELPTQTTSVSLASPGASSAVAATTPVWPMRPVEVCVTGYAVFDPMSPVVVPMPEQCRTSTL